VCIFTTPDISVYLTVTCPFLDRSSAVPTPPLRLSQNPNSGPSGSRYPPRIATPVPEGPPANDQVNHVIERLQCIFLNNGGGPSPNRGAARQLRPILPAVSPTERLRDTLFSRHWRWIHAQRRRAFGHSRMYSPPPPLGGRRISLLWW